MNSTKALLQCALLIMHLRWIQGNCERYDNHCTEVKSGSTVYFGLMLSYPDSLEKKPSAAVFNDSHNIVPAAYLAVEQINNRSDLLSDYHVKLLPLDGGCDVTERTVIGINNLACSCKPIVGIIGPSCSASALMVREFTGRNQFSMVTIHYGERNALGNREMFPFAFGILGTTSVTIQAFTDLIVRNKWNKIILYSEDVIDLVELSEGIKRSIKGISGFSVKFTSLIKIHHHSIPLREVRQSLARVILLFTSVEETLRTLCLAFHEGMIYPNYQWVFKERFENDFVETSFTYEGIHYVCSEDEINTSIHGSINFMWDLGTGDDDLLSVEHEDRYRSSNVIYDAIWSLAFALNGSLNELNMNLTHIMPGSRILAQAIANHMSDVDFQGVSGRIDFDNETGFNIARRINIYQFGAAKYSTLIGFYASNELVIFNDILHKFINATFDEKHVRVSNEIAVFFLIIRITMLLLTIAIQVINIAYRNHPSIKATSPKLNHLIFLGFYLAAIGMTLYTIVEAWPHTLNSHVLSNVCRTLPWFINIGPTLVLGTVCAKTWRLYYIHNLAKRGVAVSSKRMADPALCGYVVAIASAEVLFCLLWTCIDPLKYSEIVISSDFEIPLITVTGSCQCNWLLIWSNTIILAKCLLIFCSFLLALPTKLGRQFKTNNVLILSYILAISFGVGMPIYTIGHVIDVGTSLRFIIKCLFVDAIIYICLFALFFPTVISFTRSFGKLAK